MLVFLDQFNFWLLKRTWITPYSNVPFGSGTLDPSVQGGFSVSIVDGWILPSKTSVFDIVKPQYNPLTTSNSHLIVLPLQLIEDPSRQNPTDGVKVPKNRSSWNDPRVLLIVFLEKHWDRSSLISNTLYVYQKYYLWMRGPYF